MELLEGTDLKQAITERRLRGLDDKLDVMEQACDGLAFAHTHSIIHRDLKPANIHLLPDGQVKIMDFGLARPASWSPTCRWWSSSSSTAPSPRSLRRASRTPASS